VGRGGNSPREKEKEVLLRKKRGRKSFLKRGRGIIQNFLNGGIDDGGRDLMVASDRKLANMIFR